MLWRRLLGAALVIPPVLALFWCEDQWQVNRPGLFLVPLAALAGAAAACEMVTWLTERRLPVIGWLAIAGVPGVVLAARLAAVPDNRVAHAFAGCLIGVTCVMVLGFLHGMRSYQHPQQWFSRLAHTLLIVMYLAIPLTFLVLLRLIPPDRRGLLALFSVLFVVKLSDVGAYMAGKWLGRIHLAPRLSPHKTVEGALGGLLAGVFAAVLTLCGLAPLLLPPESLPGWLPVLGYGATITLAGIGGDLAESLLKRDLELKDAGHWLPGLGGAMDVLDSLLFAAPVAFLWWHGWG